MNLRFLYARKLRTVNMSLPIESQSKADDGSGCTESVIADGVLPDSLKCPTCGADQVPSNTCRRCGSDLALMVTLSRENTRLRRRCLALLRQRRLLLASRVAQRCWELSSDASNARLLATCDLLRGDFKAATQRLKHPGVGRMCLPKISAGDHS